MDRIDALWALLKQTFVRDENERRALSGQHGHSGPHAHLLASKDGPATLGIVARHKDFPDLPHEVRSTRKLRVQ